MPIAWLATAITQLDNLALMRGRASNQRHAPSFSKGGLKVTKHYCASCGCVVHDPCSRTFVNGHWLYFCRDCEHSPKWAKVVNRKSALSHRECNSASAQTSRKRNNSLPPDYEAWTMKAGAIVGAMFGVCCILAAII